MEMINCVQNGYWEINFSIYTHIYIFAKYLFNGISSGLIQYMYLKYKQERGEPAYGNLLCYQFITVLPYSNWYIQIGYRLHYLQLNCVQQHEFTGYMLCIGRLTQHTFAVSSRKAVHSFESLGNMHLIMEEVSMYSIYISSPSVIPEAILTRISTPLSGNSVN